MVQSRVWATGVVVKIQARFQSMCHSSRRFLTFPSVLSCYEWNICFAFRCRCSPCQLCGKELLQINGIPPIPKSIPRCSMDMALVIVLICSGFFFFLTIAAAPCPSLSQTAIKTLSSFFFLLKIFLHTYTPIALHQYTSSK